MDIRVLAGLVIIVPLALAVYLAPSLIGVKRGHHQAAPIFVTNLFLGWTGIAWVLCLAWSVSWIRDK